MLHESWYELHVRSYTISNTNLVYTAITVHHILLYSTLDSVMFKLPRQLRVERGLATRHSNPAVSSYVIV